MFWVIFTLLSVVAGAFLPLMWGLLASIPICLASWWIVYRSGWF